jgi:hypothetical protein
VGLVNPRRRGLSAGVSTATRISERTQQIHHTVVYAYARQRVTQARDDRQSSATYDHAMGLVALPTAHYYEGISNRQATWVRITFERGDTPYQEYGYA